MDVNEELNFFLKIQKTIYFFFLGGGGVGGGWGGGFGLVGWGQGGCEQRFEVFVKIQKKKNWGGGGGGGGSGWMRTKNFVKIQKKYIFFGGYVNEELNFL